MILYGLSRFPDKVFDLPAIWWIAIAFHALPVLLKRIVFLGEVSFTLVILFISAKVYLEAEDPVQPVK